MFRQWNDSKVDSHLVDMIILEIKKHYAFPGRLISQVNDVSFTQAISNNDNQSI